MAILLLIFASFVGSSLKAVGGFGFATLATPVIAYFWDVPTAIAVISIPTLLLSFLNAWRSREGRHIPITPFYLFLVATLIGMGVGFTVLLGTDPHLMKILLGLFLIIQTIWQIVAKKNNIAPKNSRPRSLFIGFLAGIMLATVNMPSHMIASYLSGLNISKHSYLFLLSGFQVLLRTLAIILLFFAGTYTTNTVGLIVAVTIPVLLGYVMGALIFRRLSDRLFFQIISAILIIMGSLLIIQNWRFLF